MSCTGPSRKERDEDAAADVPTALPLLATLPGPSPPSVGSTVARPWYVFSRLSSQSTISPSAVSSVCVARSTVSHGIVRRVSARGRLSAPTRDGCGSLATDLLRGATEEPRGTEGEEAWPVVGGAGIGVVDMLRAGRVLPLKLPTNLPAFCTSTTGELPPEPLLDELRVGLVRSEFPDGRAEEDPPSARAGLARPLVSSGGGGGVGVFRWLGTGDGGFGVGEGGLGDGVLRSGVCCALGATVVRAEVATALRVEARRVWSACDAEQRARATRVNPAGC